jgi:hypothetical protein
MCPSNGLGSQHGCCCVLFTSVLQGVLFCLTDQEPAAVSCMRIHTAYSFACVVAWLADCVARLVCLRCYLVGLLCCFFACVVAWLADCVARLHALCCRWALQGSFALGSAWLADRVSCLPAWLADCAACVPVIVLQVGATGLLCPRCPG